MSYSRFQGMSYCENVLLIIKSAVKAYEDERVPPHEKVVQLLLLYARDPTLQFRSPFVPR